jgi:alpha-tubulin suppressor-like RCC1 family protein
MGSNTDCKLGIGNQDLRQVNVPTLVDGISNIVKVACGNSHCLALGQDGVAYSWGQAFYGALGLHGNQNSFSQAVPQRVPVEACSDIAAGGKHSFFVTQSKRVMCCGDANQGQLGLDLEAMKNFDRVTVPTEVEVFRGKNVV